MGLTLLFFFPASNLVVPIGTIMGERLFYLPSAGLCLLAGVAWEQFVGWTGRTRSGEPRSMPFAVPMGVLLLVGLLVAYTGRTMLRNQDWVNTKTLFQRAVEVIPQNAKAQAVFGYELLRNAKSREELDLALKAFQGAIELYPDYPRTDPELNNQMGALFIRLGKPAEAATVFERAVVLAPFWSILHNNLALAYADLGQHEKAEATWRQALRLNPDHPRIHSNLSRFLIQRGRFVEGLAEAERALQTAPSLAWAQFNRALALEGLGRVEEAAAGYERLLGQESVGENLRTDARQRLQALRERRRGAHGRAGTDRADLYARAGGLLKGASVERMRRAAEQSEVSRTGNKA
jgi:Flp pilus assembly protein TadD